MCSLTKIILRDYIPFWPEPEIAGFACVSKSQFNKEVIQPVRPEKRADEKMKQSPCIIALNKPCVSQICVLHLCNLTALKLVLHHWSSAWLAGFIRIQANKTHLRAFALLTLSARVNFPSRPLEIEHNT